MQIATLTAMRAITRIVGPRSRLGLDTADIVDTGAVMVAATTAAIAGAITAAGITAGITVAGTTGIASSSVQAH